MKRYTYRLSAILLIAACVAGCAPKHTSIHDAAAACDVRDMAKHLRRGANMNSRDVSGSCPLHLVTGVSVKPALQASGGGCSLKTLSNNLEGFSCTTYSDADRNVQIVKGDQKRMAMAVEFLIDHKVDANTHGLLGETPLHRAAIGNLAEVVGILTAGGATVNAVDKFGDTPLHWAAFTNSVDSAKALIAHGADINATDQYGATPLHRATVFGKKSLMQLLLSKGADANAKTHDGNTPLHDACISANLEAVRVLVGDGASIRVTNRWGETPVSLAKDKSIRLALAASRRQQDTLK